MSLPAQLTASLQSTSFPLPSQTLISTLLASHPQPTLPRLLAQTKSHLLTSNLTTPSLLDPSVPIFPAPLLSPETREARLPHDVPAQIVDIEDLSRSRWEQVEELERIERGEMTKGRAVVRVDEQAAEGEEGEARTTQGGGGGAAVAKAKRNATHRVVLQDRSGRKVFGLELTRMERLGIGVTRIGEKVVVRKGAVVARGSILLEPATCTFLGGYIESEEKKWVGERLKVLREAVGATDAR